MGVCSSEYAGLLLEEVDGKKLKSTTMEGLDIEVVFVTAPTTSFLKYVFFEGINAFRAAMPFYEACASTAFRDIVYGIARSASKECFVSALTTSFLTVPFFEGINAFCAAMPIYEAFASTAIRDVAYGIARNASKEFFVMALTASFLKFPFFVGISAFSAAMPIYEPCVSTAIRDIVYGIARNTFTDFFVTALTTRFLKLPFFAGICAFCAAMPVFEAYVSTAIRDIVYGIASTCCTFVVLSAFPQWTVASPPRRLFLRRRCTP